MTKKSPSPLEQGFYLHLNIQVTEDREQRTEDREQMTEDREQMTENR
jgi:hypothetical protein